MASIKRNYIYSIIYQLLNIGIPVITVPYVSRIFGPEKLGTFSYVNTIGQYFIMFSMLGLANYGNREIAAVRDNKEKLDKTFCEIFCMQLTTSLISFIIFLFIFALPQEELLHPYYVILLLLVISPVFDVNWFFWGMEEFGITVFRNSIIKAISFVSILIFVKTQDDLGIYFFIYSLSSLMSSLFLWPSLLRNVCFVRVSLKKVLYRLKPNLMLFVPILAISLYKYMDRIMLGNYSYVETGYYDNSEKVTTMLFGFIASLGTVMLPRVSYLVSNGQEDLATRYTEKSLDFVMFISVAMTFGLSSVADSFVPLFFGQGFEPCVLLISCLSLTLIFCSWANVVRTQILIPYKKDKIYLYSVVVGAVANFCINILLIPKYGAIGAVVGTIVAEFLVAFSQTCMVRDEFEFKKTLKKTLIHIVFGLCMSLILRLEYLYLALDTYKILSVQVFTGLVLYSAYLLCNKSIRENVVSYIR